VGWPAAGPQRRQKRGAYPALLCASGSLGSSGDPEYAAPQPARPHEGRPAYPDRGADGPVGVFRARTRCRQARRGAWRRARRTAGRRGHGGM